MIADTGPVARPDAFVDPEDAHVEPTDDAAVDAPAVDATPPVDAAGDVGSDNG